MKTAILAAFTLILFITAAQAETACQYVNKTGQINNAQGFVKSTNKLLKSKGAKYRTTVKEVTNTIKNFCKKDPYGTEDDIIKHFIQLSDVLAASNM